MSDERQNFTCQTRRTFVTNGTHEKSFSPVCITFDVCANVFSSLFFYDRNENSKIWREKKTTNEEKTKNPLLWKAKKKRNKNIESWNSILACTNVLNASEKREVPSANRNASDDDKTEEEEENCTPDAITASRHAFVRSTICRMWHYFSIFVWLLLFEICVRVAQQTTKWWNTENMVSLHFAQ